MASLEIRAMLAWVNMAQKNGKPIMVKQLTTYSVPSEKQSQGLHSG